MKGTAPIRDHAREQAAALLRRVALQVNRAARQDDADAVHDLRVSIRRFSQCLRAFDGFFKAGRIRKRLKRLMRAAAEVRNRDIAIQMMGEAGMAANPRSAALAKEREAARQALVEEIRSLRRRGFVSKWRGRLGL